MIIETKYNIGDQVVKIGFDRREEKIKCPACSGRGEIELDDGKMTMCPKCWNRGFVSIWHDERWQIRGVMTIGQVMAKITNFVSNGDFNNVGHQGDDSNTEYEYSYMCYESGIGSGTVHYQDTLYTDYSSAQSECDRRNTDGDLE